jgi:hypothetical protein
MLLTTMIHTAHVIAGGRATEPRDAERTAEDMH